jgi:hypothetical protein
VVVLDILGWIVKLKDLFEPRLVVMGVLHEPAAILERIEKEVRVNDPFRAVFL